MQRTIAAILLYLGLATAALAQTNFNMPPPAGVTVMGLQVVTACGAGALSNTKPAYATMDITGVLCTSAGGGGGGGLSVVDGATFTPGTSSFTPTGGEYNSSPTTCTSGKQCTAAMTVNREVRTHDTDVLAAVNSAIPAGTNTIGNTGTDPSSGKATPAQAFLALPATTTTQIIALSGVKVTYVTLSKLWASGVVNVTFKYGTGSNCGTGTTTLEGPYALAAQAGWVEGNGSGPVMVVPSGQALCVTTDATLSNSGVKLIYQQF